MDTPRWHVPALGELWARYVTSLSLVFPASPLVTPAWLRCKPAADSGKGASLSLPLVGTAGSPRC